MQFDQLKRRDFVAMLGGAAFAWPLAARAQQGDRVRRVGALMFTIESDPMSKTRVVAFQQNLENLGWKVGRNLQIDYRRVFPTSSGPRPLPPNY